MYEFLKENVWHETDRTGNICPLVYIVFIYYACLFYNPDAQGNVAERQYFLLLKKEYQGTVNDAQKLIDEASPPVSGGTAGSPITPRAMSEVSKKSGGCNTCNDVSFCQIVKKEVMAGLQLFRQGTEDAPSPAPAAALVDENEKLKEQCKYITYGCIVLSSHLYPFVYSEVC
jgi:hypothetical protein